MPGLLRGDVRPPRGRLFPRPPPSPSPPLPQARDPEPARSSSAPGTRSRSAARSFGQDPRPSRCRTPAFFPLPGKGAAWALRQLLEPFHREGSALEAGLQDLPCVGRRARIAARHALCAGLWGRAGARGGLWAPGARAPRSGDRGAGARTTARHAERAGARGARPQRTMRPLPPIPRSGGQGGGRSWNKGGVEWGPSSSHL